MISIPLKKRTVREYLGGCAGYNPCQDISKIHCTDHGNGTATVEARIPASTSNERYYTIEVHVTEDGDILLAECSCPVASDKCKHIYKVLLRIVNSFNEPLPGPTKRKRAQLMRGQRQEKQFRCGACVYLAFACRSELDSGSDYGRSHTYKDNFDQTLIGVFFSLKEANQCAKDHLVENLGHVIDEDTDEEEEEVEEEESDDDEEVDSDDDDGDDDEEYFVWDGSDHDEFDGITFDKVWVECRAIEDASSDFHK